MATQNLLYKDRLQITDLINVMIPTVGEILEQDDDYYGMVYMITSTPYDMMVQLDDIGIDFTQIDDYGLFLMVFNTIKSQDTSLIFGDFDLSNFDTVFNCNNNMMVLKDSKTGAVIDKGIYWQICQALRKIHNLKRNNRKPANGEAKKYMLQRTRDKMKRRKNRTESSQLEELIVSLVNTEQFNYRFDSVRDLTIYQFNESVQQIIKKIDFDNKMRGIYAGTISVKDMSQDDLNWLTKK